MKYANGVQAMSNLRQRGVELSTDVQTFREDIERPTGGIGFPRTLRLLVRGKNIHEDTLLATDYLNHFNEIIMLLGLVADMPECLEDALEWAPKSYEDHFSDSGFHDKELAILAYENAPRRYREPFDQLVAQMDATVFGTISRIEQATKEGDTDRLRHLVSGVTRKLQRLVDVASAIIHGRVMVSGQDEIDALLAEVEGDEAVAPPEDTSVDSADSRHAPSDVAASDSEATNQADIDALFD